MRKIYIAGALALATAGALPAVASADTRCVNPQNNTTTGALVGAAGGAAVGSVLAGRGSRGGRRWSRRGRSSRSFSVISRSR